MRTFVNYLFAFYGISEHPFGALCRQRRRFRKSPEAFCASVKYLVYPVIAIQQVVCYGVSWLPTCYKPVPTNKR